ncbi:MAG: ABC transporter substrate-binding protein [Alphaproteobacteria bacterium]|nr:ABC transporter substrate-binding protein [Alphaproteobacteria bacterium]
MRLMLRALVIAAGLLLLPQFATAAPVHALAMHGTPKYAPGFKQFDYVNADAPKGGQSVRAAIGSYDNLNPFIVRGTAAIGVMSIYDTLTTPSADEPFTQYCLLCESMDLAADRSSIVFTLRADARWHDGKPITAEDVVWSFETLRAKGLPFYRSYYGNVAEARATAPNKVRFTFSTTENRELPLIIGQMTVLPKHYWATRDFGATTLEPPLGSGPYRIAQLDAGRSITLERVKDYWAAAHPTQIGRNNIDLLRYDYYRDQTVALEALKGGAFDIWNESSSKNWATAYDTPAVRGGQLIKAEFKHQRVAGMQGFVFNTRRPVFQDRRVRAALAYAFDFTWSNANLFYGAYTRSKSFWDNSELASRGLLASAGAEERALLEKYRAELPPELFTAAYVPPDTDGTQASFRANLLKARDQLAAAGWQVVNNKLVNRAAGKPMSFEILLDDPTFERIALPFVENLNRLGIEAKVRLVDSSQYQERVDTFDFDMTVGNWGQSESPGNEQRDYWGSDAAAENGTMNLAGVKDPAIDALIEELIAAPTRESLVARTRALDRALLWGHYVIPHWYIPHDRVAYWDKFGQPAKVPSSGVQIDTWWMKAGR